MAVSATCTRGGFASIVFASLLGITVSNTCSYVYYTYNYDLGYRGTTQGYMYCSYGCCGTHPDYSCCSDSSYYSYYYYYYYNDRDMTAGAITGIVLGSMVSLGIIIGIIVCSVVMCRNSRLKRQQAVSSAGVIYHPRQGVTMLPAAPVQMSPGGVVYHTAPVVQQSTQPNFIQAGHVVQYPSDPQTIQQGQTAHVPSTAGNQTSAAASLPVQASGSTVSAQASESKSKDPPPMYTA